MKKHTNIEWVVLRIKEGNTIHDISKECNISIFTASKYFNQAVNTLTTSDVILLSKIHRNITKVISPKTQLYQNIVTQTSFLPSTTNIRQRLWHIDNKQEEYPLCKMCPTNVKWEIDKQEYRIYCSVACANSDCDSLNEKRKQTNIKKRGVEFWNQTHITPTSLSKLQDKDWLIDQHKNQNKALTQIAKELDVHPLLPAQYLARYGIKGQQNSQCEQELGDFIAQLYDQEIILNSRKVIPPYEIDVYLPSINVAFEFNGTYWHSELAGKDKHYHLNKTQMCNNKGIRLIHIYEHEWLLKNDIVKSRIRNILHKNSERVYARKCKIVTDIPSDVVRSFLNENHIQGYVPASLVVGLELEDKLVCLMTLGKSRYVNNNGYELLRLCSLAGINVIGGATRLFKHITTNYDINEIISYSSKAWNTGNVYNTIGFAFSHSSSPSYTYFKNNENIPYSRQKFQKHKLKEKLETFNPKLTEWENMKNNGYNRIWDCGNDVYVWRDI